MKYTYQHTTIQPPISVVDSYCNAVLFYNSGATTVNINGFPLVPGASLSLDSHAGETDVSKYQIAFAAGTGTLEVWRKTYTK